MDQFEDTVNRFIALYLPGVVGTKSVCSEEPGLVAENTCECCGFVSHRINWEGAEFLLDTAICAPKGKMTYVFRISCPCGAQLCEWFAPFAGATDAE